MTAFRSFAGKLRQQALSVGWLVVEKFVLLASGVAVGFWVIRTLGPDQFGRLSAAISIVAVFTGFATMGLETVVLRRLAARTAPAASVLKSAAWLRIFGSFAHVAACWLTSKLLFADSPDVAFAALILAVSAFFRTADVNGLWLQNEGRYRDATLLRVATRIIGDIARVGLIFQGASMHWFAAAFLLEAIVTCGLFLRCGSGLWKTAPLDYPLVRSLFRDGSPIAISAILAACYARLDQVVLYSTMGATENGHYAAAVRISEVFNLLITSIGTVSAPYFGRLHGASDGEFESRLMTYNRYMLCAGVLASATVCAFAGPIVTLMYGTSFSPAETVLRVHCWSIALVFASVALEPWFYHYGKLDYYVTKTLLALLFAIPTTIIATLHYGARGTAAAVLATYAVSVFLTNALLPGTRRAFHFQVRALIGNAGASR